MKKKRAFTLLEIMIGIFLIGLIGSIIGYNMRGSLSEGKAFKSRQAADRLVDVFELEIATDNTTKKEIDEDPVAVLTNSGLLKNPKNFLKDGWGVPFNIEVSDDGYVTVTSDKLIAYETKKGRKTDDEDDE